MKHVLFADNERSIRRFVKQELESEGYGVILTEDGTETLEMLDRFVVDVVILDEHMPRCSGLEAAKRIKQRHPDLPVVLFTADADYERYKSSYVDAAILKSADLGMLKAAIGKLSDDGKGATAASRAMLPPLWMDAKVECSGSCRGAGVPVPHSQ
jgi:DNA-binding NtrC family response regulator